MSFRVHLAAAFLFSPFLLFARQLPDGVVLEHDDDALRRDGLAFETRLLNLSSSPHSTVEVLQNAAAASAAAAANTLAQLRLYREKLKITSKRRRFDDVARKNLMHYERKGKNASEKHSATFFPAASSSSSSSGRPPSIGPLPGDVAPPFRLYTLNGVLQYPQDLFFLNSSVLFVTFNNQSGFSGVSWTDAESLKDFVSSAPEDARFVFSSSAADAESAASDAIWMRSQLQRAVDALRKTAAANRDDSSDRKLKRFIRDRCAFVATPTSQMGNWIPRLLQRWSCSGHGCGLDQVVFEAKNAWLPLVLKRLDARYDWLPTASSIFGNETLSARILSSDGCGFRPHLEGLVVVVTRSGGCDVAEKIAAMNDSGAAGVIFAAPEGEAMKEIVCVDEECDWDLGIPASVVPFSHFFATAAGANLTVRYQNTPSPNLCFTVDRLGRLGECGWLLYPSLRFYAWQAQWLTYEETLRARLPDAAHPLHVAGISHRRQDNTSSFSSSSSPSSSSLIVDAFDFATMQGDRGVAASFDLPPWRHLRRGVARLRLDAALSCPGGRDEDCPPWDHVVHLTICCDVYSDLCGAELGRWITPFRRRVGRWLTDVTPLLPLLRSPTNRCNVTMKTVPWAKAWRPALRLLFTMMEEEKEEEEEEEIRKLSSETKPREKMRMTPTKTLPLFSGGRFDSDYNAKYQPMFFLVPESVVKVVVVATITGHGSDDNQCGEFCPTSHVFYVNHKVYNKTFHRAGSPLGCAETVSGGSIPNEHGTWLYGRGGWCDGRQVDPWVIDVTDDVVKNADHHHRRDVEAEDARRISRPKSGGGTLIIDYKGYYQGKDPSPKKNPGEIIMSSYLSYYELS